MGEPAHVGGDRVLMGRYSGAPEQTLQEVVRRVVDILADRYGAGPCSLISEMENAEERGEVSEIVAGYVGGHWDEWDGADVVEVTRAVFSFVRFYIAQGWGESLFAGGEC